MTFEFYRWLHMFGIFCLMMGFGLLIAYFSLTSSTNKAKAIRKMGFISHGIGLAFLIVSGFGLLARLGILSEFPRWVALKLAIWFLLGSAIALVKRKPEWNFYLVPTIIALALVAAYLGIYKPGSSLPLLLP